jgi:O-antigen/teichoic acid export membrane protein
MILVTIVNLYTSRIVLQTLGFEDFGLYNVIASVVVFFSFFNYALKNATTRFLSVELGKNDLLGLKQTYSMAINLHMIMAGAVLVILELVGVWFINTQLTIAPERMTAANWVFQFSLLTFCLSMMQIPYDASIIAHERMDFYAIISIVEALAKLGVAFLLIISPIDKLIAYGALMLLVALLVFGGYAGYCKAKLNECRYIRYWNKAHIRQFGAYSGWSLLVNTADVVVIQGRAILFNMFLGLVANAALGIANQVYNALAMFARNFASAFNPQIYKSYAAGEKKYFMQLVFSTSKISYYLLLLPLLPLLLNLPFVLEIWLGKYPDITPWYIAAMMLFAVFDAFQAPLWNAIFATGNIKTHQIMMAVIKLLVLPLSWLVLFLGDNGIWTLLVWGLGNVVCALARIIYAKGFLGLDLWNYTKEVIGQILLVTLLTVPLPAYIVYRLGQGWMSLGITTVLSILLICVCAYWVGLTKEEKQMVHKMPIINKFCKSKNE